jgi:mono/diheme cytochrome c family protein
MKRSLLLLSAALVLSATFTACTRRHSEPLAGRSLDRSQERIRHGEIVYNMHCQRCHPSGGAGLGPDVLSKPGFARRMQVRHGLGAMPAFKKDVISRKDMNDMQAYLRQLKRLR